VNLAKTKICYGVSMYLLTHPVYLFKTPRLEA
jgi:hypothetical protein